MSSSETRCAKRREVAGDAAGGGEATEAKRVGVERVVDVVAAAAAEAIKKQRPN